MTYDKALLNGFYRASALLAMPTRSL